MAESGDDLRRVLELFLLSGMRRIASVDRALREMRASRGDLRTAVASVDDVDTRGLPFHSLAFFLDRVSPDQVEAVEPTEFGDRRCFVSMSSWPEARYTYLRRPDGIATCTEFVPAVGRDLFNLETADDFHPWVTTRSEVESRLGTPLMTDEWEFDCGLVYEIPARIGERASRYRFDFDHGLLQLIRKLS